MITDTANSGSRNDSNDQPPTKAEKITSLIAVVVPFVGFILGIILLWGRGIRLTDVILFGVLYVFTGLGITVGFHRLFTHNSFKAHRAVRVALAILGSMALEGSVFKWCYWHRRHHKYADKPGDVHSPHGFGKGLKGFLKGMWFSHIGWFFRAGTPNDIPAIQDLKKDSALVIVNKLYPLWIFLSLAVPALVGGLVTLSFLGAFLGFVWGGLVRIFLLHHATWSINSICHWWGRKTFRTDDESRDNLFFAIFGLGEGNHNSHHAFEYSPRQGFGFWRPDPSWFVIWSLMKMGLVWDVRLPSALQLEAKRIR